jgi:cyclic-di-GMP-binding biofilm dispersal mediator protein
MTNLDGAHVLVVGATGGLGSAISRALADRGAVLSISGRSAERLDELGTALGGGVLGTTVGDLVDPTIPELLVTEASGRRPLTGVVVAAGVVAFGDVVDLDDDVLDQLVLVNLMAPIRIARAAAAVLPAGGFVANVSAVVAEQPMKGMAAYSATKAGLTAFDRAVATELRRRQIRVLDVRPGHTETGLVDRPIAGSSPRLPTGNDPARVADRIVTAIADDERDLPAAAFG